MELLLLRHGLTRANLEHRFCGRTDWPLLPEAYRALDPMVQSGALPVVEIACHTGLLRTLQTAERLFPGVPLQSAPALSEFDFGEFEALTHEDLQHHPDYIRWLMEFETMACPHGEAAQNSSVGSELDGRHSILCGPASLKATRPGSARS